MKLNRNTLKPIKARVLLFASALGLLISFGSPLVPQTHAAGSLYFSPSSKTVQNGVNFTVAIRAAATSTADTVITSFTYPASQVEYVSTSLSGGVTPFQAYLGAGNGNFSMTTSVSPGNPAFGGDVLIATITFKPKVASGSGQLAFDGDAALILGGIEQGSGGSPMTLGYSSAPAAPTTTTTTTTTNKTTTTPATIKPGSTIPAAPTPDKTAPQISEVKATSTGPKTVTITWKTNEAATSVVEFGLDEKLGLSVTGEDGDVMDHSVALNPSYIEPGMKLYYRVKSTDQSGNTITGDVQQYVVPGVKATITVKTKDGKKVSGASVTYAGKTQKTGSDGSTTFENVAVGKQTFSVKSGGEVKSFTVDVKTDSTDQKFDLEVEKAGNMLPLILGILLVIAVIAGIIWFLKKRGGGGSGTPWKKSGEEMVVGGTPTSTTTQTIDAGTSPAPKPNAVVNGKEVTINGDK